MMVHTGGMNPPEAAPAEAHASAAEIKIKPSVNPHADRHKRRRFWFMGRSGFPGRCL
jgi:hypothetical protein